MGKLARIVLACAVALGCGCSSNPKAEDASQKTDEAGQTGATSEPEPDPVANAEPTSDPGKVPPTGVKATGFDRGDDNSVPDDYSLTERDCDLLGQKLGALWRLDLRAQLSPKLNEKQREKAELSIEEGASKKADDWSAGCIKSLAGKSVDPKAIKCAMDSKDLKAFEKCLN